jgi:plastocyanin
MSPSAVFYGPPTMPVQPPPSVARVKQTIRRAGAALPAVALAALMVAGCSSGSSGGSASPASSGGSASEPTYAVTVVGKTITGVPTRITVSPGEKVRLVVTADRASELHVHAAEPEVETKTEEGQPVTVEFDAKKQPGLYEVEMHDPDLLLMQVQVK